MWVEERYLVGKLWGGEGCELIMSKSRERIFGG